LALVVAAVEQRELEDALEVEARRVVEEIGLRRRPVLVGVLATNALELEHAHPAGLGHRFPVARRDGLHREEVAVLIAGACRLGTLGLLGLLALRRAHGFLDDGDVVELVRVELGLRRRERQEHRRRAAPSRPLSACVRPREVRFEPPDEWPADRREVVESKGV